MSYYPKYLNKLSINQIKQPFTPFGCIFFCSSVHCIPDHFSLLPDYSSLLHSFQFPFPCTVLCLLFQAHALIVCSFFPENCLFLCSCILLTYVLFPAHCLSYSPLNLVACPFRHAYVRPNIYSPAHFFLHA